MFGDTVELAENKLLLLYIFHKIKLPISNNQITQIILENNLMNYFTLQQYLSELTSSNFLERLEEEGKIRLGITDKGDKVLCLFKNRVSESKLQTIEAYLVREMDKIKKELTITADYTIENDHNFIVHLKALENDVILMELKVNVASNKQARELCSKWRKNASEMYSQMMHYLMTD